MAASLQIPAKKHAHERSPVKKLTHERDDPIDGKVVDCGPCGTLCLKSVIPGAGGWANHAHCDETLSVRAVE